MVTEFFSASSPLKVSLPSFSPRKEQQTLAVTIAESIEQNKHLVAEAGTGTGKTFAYLVPAILANKKVIISTGTKTLQDQLFYKDLPRIKESTKQKLKTSLLKGRQNYICLHHLEVNAEQLSFSHKASLDKLQLIRRKHKRTKFGETAEIKEIPEDSEVWHAVTSTRDNCLGQECDYYQDCYLNKARKRALEADVIVVNHHLLLADYGLKEEGFGELLPQAELIILDEAHQLPDIATHFYGERLSSRQLLELANDIDLEYLLNAKDMRTLSETCHQLTKAVKDMRIAMGDSGIKQAWQAITHNKLFNASIEKVSSALVDLGQSLELASGRSKALEGLWERYLALKIKFERLTSHSTSDFIHWYETFAQSFIIYQSPLVVREAFQETLIAFDAPCIFTSATLTVNKKFDHYLYQLGLENQATLYVNSPFSFDKQALLYVPRGIPDTKAETYTEKVVDAAIPVIEAAKGRTFFLFTSYYAMNQAAEKLAQLIELPLFIQGTKAKDALLSDFVASGNGVLLATASFWEGVDVPGKALSCVIIDKLPFVAPTDPVYKARAAKMQEEGKQPFFEYALPQAVITLKQGVGRLIRDISDYGVLMLCDPRLIGKNYGEIFMNTLSEYPRTREFSKVVQFLHELED